MDYLIGASLALGIGLGASLVGFDKERGFYPLVTMVIASYYILFAVIGGSLTTVILEASAGIAFWIAAISGFKRTRWLIVAALVGHGVFDLGHGHIIDNPGVPVWWPRFCLAYDLVAAAYLALQIWRSRQHPAYLEPSIE